MDLKFTSVHSSIIDVQILPYVTHVCLGNEICLAKCLSFKSILDIQRQDLFDMCVNVHF